MGQKAAIKTIDGHYVVAAHVISFKRHPRPNGQPGVDLYAATTEEDYLIIENTTVEKEEQLLENIGLYSCTEIPLDWSVY